MELTYVDILPDRKSRKGRRQRKKEVTKILEDFVNSKSEVARIDFDETDYVSALSCCQALRNAINKYKRAVRVHIRGNSVYLTTLLYDL